MISRLIATVRAPGSPWTALAGAVLAGAGLGLLARYQRHLLDLTAQAAVDLEHVDRLLADRTETLDRVTAEIGARRRDRSGAEPASGPEATQTED